MVQERPAPRVRPSRWKRFRRWSGLVLLSLCLGAGLLALYFNKVDLPQPFKELVLAEFSKSGWDLHFSKMRLRWHRGLVIEDLTLRHQHNPNAPELMAPDAQLRVNRLALLRLEMRIDAVILRQGQLTWTEVEAKEPVRATGVELKAHRVDGDDWQLGMLRAQLLGVSIDLQGAITNVLDLAQWPWPRREKPLEPRTDPGQWLRVLNQCRFGANATLTGSCWGDGRAPESFRALLQVNTSLLMTPWGSASNLNASAELFPPSPGRASSRLRLLVAGAAAQAGPFEASSFRLRIGTSASLTKPQPANFQCTATFQTLHHPKAALTNLSVIAKIEPPTDGRWPLGEANFVLEAVETPWGRAQGLRSLARWTATPNSPGDRLSELALAVQHLDTPWVAAGPMSLRARGVHEHQQPWPTSLSLSLDSHQTETRWGQCAEVLLEMNGTAPKNFIDTNLSWTERLAPVQLNLNLALGDVHSDQLHAEKLRVDLDWQSPFFEIRTTNRLYGGELELAARVDTSTRLTQFQGLSSFDLHELAPLLKTNGQRWITKYAWKHPPRVHGQGQLRLPAWTNGLPDWRTDILPTLSLAAGFEIGPASYKQIPFDSARSNCVLSNLVWTLPNLEITRPEGTARARYQSHVHNRDFQWDVEGALDPRVLVPLLQTPSARKKLDELHITSPPNAVARITGRWGHPELLDVSGEVNATNFAFRGQPVAYAASRVHYTNQFLSLIQPFVLRSNESGTADGLGIDIGAHRVYLTNATARLDPQAVATAIGDKTARVLEPYRFDRPPSVRVEGYVDTRRGNHDTHLEFDVEGGPFHWKRCHVDQIMGKVFWAGQALILTNLQAQFGSGQIAGNARFDFMQDEGASFSFMALAGDVDLRHLNETFFSKTNDLEGALSGVLVITSANTADTNSWAGYGNVYMRDGMIWDIPMFGVFSPILNAFIPGLGNSRARRAEAAFSLTNSVLWTTDLAIDATAMRMQYDGTVALDGRVRGRMKAELLRNLPGFGFLVSRILWPVTKLFEYHVTGTLAQPKTEPVWIVPRLIFLPFQPVKTVRDLLPETDPDD